MTDETRPIEPDEIHNEDFQYVLKRLLRAYRPILEEDLRRAEDPEQLKKEAEEKPPSCDDEIELANRIFEKFLTEKVAERLLPPEGRELLGPKERWNWCLLHIRCCIIFGWLVCRGPRTFRAFVYYLYKYWICVRQAVGTPVHSPLSADERHDFQTLVQALANAYKPYLTDQLASVEFPDGIPDEILDGSIDCFEGQEDTAAIFERLLTMETAPALLGKEAFEAHRQEPYFWFCRCWCLCAIRFGCCLARARNFIDLLRCLVYFWRCLRKCFWPLTCEIIKPAMNECAVEQFFPGPGVLGIQIVGTATGLFCDHYTLEWKAAGAPDTDYSGGPEIVYPGGPGPGTCGVVNGVLGYLSTAVGPIPNDVTVRLCVFGAPGTPPCCDTVTFQIFRQRVWITGIEGVIADPGVLDPGAQLRAAGVVRSFGTALRIHGRAWVGKCTGREIKRYTLSYQPGFVVNPLVGPWTQFWQVDYLTPLQRKEIQTSEFALTSSWYFQHICLPPPHPPGICFPKDWLRARRWRSGRSFPSVPVAPQSFPVDPQVPAVVWASQQLPPTVNCQSGRYTLRLDVEDTLGDHYYDIQHVWFDNKEIHGRITQIAGVPACGSIDLSQFAAPGGNCLAPWPADLLGIAYDEYIEEGNLAVPSDNFGGYRLWIKKDGAPDPGVELPIPGPGAPPWGPPFVGTSRVGDPPSRCATAAPPPVGPIPPPPGIALVLASLDMRRLDAVCNPAEPALTLDRAYTDASGNKVPGECCGYVITLKVWDTSICPSLPDRHHSIFHHFPICICNDLVR